MYASKLVGSCETHWSVETEITYNMEDLTEPIGKNEEFEKHLEEGDVITDLDTVDWEAIVEELVEKAERENYKESEALEFELEHRGYKVYRRISDEDTFVIKKEGEMDVLALHEAGITNAISVPNGATLNTNNLDYLDNCIDYFDDMSKIIIAVDSDAPGQALQTELIRRLGAETCFLATFDDCKDANEYLQKYGKLEIW